MTTRKMKSHRFRKDHLEQLEQLKDILDVDRSDLIDEAITDLLNKYRHLLVKEPTPPLSGQEE